LDDQRIIHPCSDMQTHEIAAHIHTHNTDRKRIGGDAREEDERQRLEQQEPEELRPKMITAGSGQEADAAWLEFTAWKHKPSGNMDDRG